MKRLENKKAIITGSARGIGKAIARKFLQEGAHVFLVDIQQERLLKTRDELASLGGEVQVYTADVSQKAQVQSLVETVLKTWGEVDILVNNAGIAIVENFLDLKEENWDRTLDVNLKSMFLVSQLVARDMVKKGRGGAIVNMASTNGLLGEAGLAHYNASKAGVILLTKTLAIELAPYNIRVNCVCPGFIKTELAAEAGFNDTFIAEYVKKIPLNRHGKPEEVANVFAFLASDEASFITGASIVIDGGQIIKE
ncbi:MAG TPA: SDR family NAD(P)-dependent oxidoreductase [Candidatus Limnocylindrales bacterium]|nr:SDR family NAD(P)-dependent oxidoreductase [Candidatus Limnocylindrales bacterium]